MEKRERIGIGIGLDWIERKVKDDLGKRIIEMKNEWINEISDKEIEEIRIRIDIKIIWIMEYGNLVYYLN